MAGCSRTYLRFDRAGVLAFESWVLQPEATLKQPLGRLDGYASDDRLLRFLRLRPLLKDLYPSEVQSSSLPSMTTALASGDVVGLKALAPMYADIALEIEGQSGQYVIRLKADGQVLEESVGALPEDVLLLPAGAASFRDPRRRETRKVVTST